ncbi:MAG: hypothetical protein JW798_03645 [Prolixibacteraceae bacterium]|nr:hypothetical protein [Prolixibacteraceae bacterium]
MNITFKTFLFISEVFLFLLFSGSTIKATAQAKFTAEFLPGGAIAFNCPISIEQENYSDLNFTAHYRTESFKLPLHYSVRIGYNFNMKQGVEIEFNHLKLILDNTSDEIERFSITHGFNQLWINYVHSACRFEFRSGIGPVLAHPESIIRDQKFDESGGIAQSGYHICGITGQLGIQKKFYLGRHFFFSTEVKINLAYADAPISNGNAEVWVFDVQGLAGIGLALNTSNK